MTLRLSARECRLRKKIKQDEILKQIAFYETENLSLRLKLKLGSETKQLEEDDIASYNTKLETLVRILLFNFI